MEFEALWQKIVEGLAEPLLLNLPDDAGEGGRFHAWHDLGGDGRPEAIWTKPLQGEKQIRLPQHKADYRKVYEAVRDGRCDGPRACREIASRGHYIYAVIRHFGGLP